MDEGSICRSSGAGRTILASGCPKVISKQFACLDWSAASERCALVAYRWDGETESVGFGEAGVGVEIHAGNRTAGLGGAAAE